MIFFPAIDLKDGACVRLLRGDMDKATVFSRDPAAQARAFQDQGAEWLHVVDLNGAFAGKPVNMAAVRNILDSISIPIQLGGGIRSMALIEEWLASGVARVILGTVALRDPVLAKEACKKFPGRIAVGIDAKQGMVAVEGWAENSGIAALDLARQFENAGAASVIYTDIGRDGAMQGPDIEGTRALAAAVGIPVIASGGVSSLADLRSLAAVPGLAGAISGRAIYDGAFTIREAVEVFSKRANGG